MKTSDEEANERGDAGLTLLRMPTQDLDNVPEPCRNSIVGVPSRSRTARKYASDPEHAGERDSLSWDSPEYICNEEDGTLDLRVMRRGKALHDITCDWRTVKIDDGAKHTREAADQKGSVSFKAGQMWATVTVSIPNDEQWNVTAGLNVEIYNLSEFCYLGEIPVTTVAMLNDDTFPAQLPPEKLSLEGAWHQFAVVLAFCSHNHYLFRREVRLGFLYRTYPAIDFLVQRMLMVAVVNAVLEKRSQVYFIAYAIVYICNMMLAYAADRQFRFLRIGSKATRSLRTALVSTLIQLTPEEAERQTTGLTQRVVDDQVQRAVARTWTGVFDMYTDVARLVVMVAISFWLVSGVSAGLFVYFIPVVMVLCDAVIFLQNIVKQSALVRRAMEAADVHGEFQHEISNLRNLINAYRNGFEMSAKYRDKHALWDALNFEAAQHEARAQWMAKVVPGILAATLLYTAGVEVRDQPSQPVGEYVALLQTTIMFGGALSSIFSAAFRMSQGYASIAKIAELLNASTWRKEALVQSREEVERIEAYLASGGTFPAADHIYVHEVTYAYKHRHRVEGGDEGHSHRRVAVEAIPAISAVIEPEQIVAITSAGPAGKATILRLLARQFRPSSGFVKFPTWWRVRLVEMNPKLFDDTLMFNLRFGNCMSFSDAEIWELCKRLGMSSHIIGKGSLMVGEGGVKLASSDRVCVALARVLLSGVNLLLLVHTLDVLGYEKALKVFSVLEQWVDERGLLFLSTAHSEYTDRPNRMKMTCILSTKLPQLAKRANSRLMVKTDGAGS